MVLAETRWAGYPILETVEKKLKLDSLFESPKTFKKPPKI